MDFNRVKISAICVLFLILYFMSVFVNIFNLFDILIKLILLAEKQLIRIMYVCKRE